jgi:steroid delta-isomerase-like uncharacterized protein
MSQALLTVTDPAHVARPVNAFFEAVNAGDIDAGVAALAPGSLHHGKVSNYRPEGVGVLFTMLREVFPDLRLDVREQRVDGRRVVSRVVATGTHTGTFLGRPASGRPVAWQSIDIAEVDAEGRIARRFWDVWSDATLWKEIGFTPALMC